jgi:AraC family transcriptional regulator, regulatory protein of adaptative response / methylated-DNA-[protein]-cysteine methyltransferase
MLATHPTLIDDARWQAIVERDRDARFVFGVHSTRIFCRPGCPARLPRREGVTPFESCEQAREAGYRACKRCRPGEPDATAELVERACRLIDEAVDAPPTLDELASRLGMSPYHLQRTFKATVGLTPRQYARTRRVERLKASLGAGDAVTRAVYDAGFGSSSRVYERSNEELGMSPGTYGRGGAGMAIRTAVAPSSLGWVLVAGTDRGICAVRIGDDPAALVTGLRDEFHAAEIQEDGDGPLADWLPAVVAAIDGDRPTDDLPLDIRATAFQRRVWRALAAIPYGTVTTYSALARQLGVPGGARAVGGACAANPVAIVVPCHRVVRQDGGLGGYRWGAQRKERLLAHERVEQARVQGNDTLG